MKTATKDDRETLLKVIESYALMIERHNATGKLYPAAVLSDILASARAVSQTARKEDSKQ